LPDTTIGGKVIHASNWDIRDVRFLTTCLWNAGMNQEYRFLKNASKD